MNILDFHHLVSKKNLILEPKDPYVVTVKDVSEGFALAKSFLYEVADKKTALFLSGGKTPKEFYEMLAKEEKLSIGAVGLIDERYGKSMHENSNERMIEQSGLLRYLQFTQTPFYPILKEETLPIEKAAAQYDETLRFLFNGFGKSVGVLGIGIDGHTAGIPIHSDSENKDQSLVTFFTDFPGEVKERISMTFLGVSMLDMIIVMVFGEDKKHALQALFADGPESEIPARFFKRKEIAQKTLLITDQKV